MSNHANQVVLIDDDVDYGRLLLSYLKDDGLETQYYDNLASLQSNTEPKAIDVLILDFWLYRENGLDIVNDLQKIAPNIPIILISSDRKVIEQLDSIPVPQQVKAIINKSDGCQTIKNTVHQYLK